MLLTVLLLSLCSRLLVSASQDGKLIIWDSYTTNKVGTADHALKTSPGKGRCLNSEFTYAQFVKEREEEHSGVAFRVKLFGPNGNLLVT